MKLSYSGASKLAIFGAVTVAGLSLPLMAFAEEAANEENPMALLLPNPGEFVPMLIGFILLWVILAKFGWPAIIGMLDKRVNTIRESLEQAEETRLESARLLEEQQAQTEAAKKQAAQIIADAKQAAESVRADITAKAQEEAAAMVAKATAAVQAEKKAAIAQLQGSVADLSVAVAGRLIGADLSDAEHRKIIERYLTEAGSFDAN